MFSKNSSKELLKKKSFYSKIIIDWFLKAKSLKSDDAKLQGPTAERRSQPAAIKKRKAGILMSNNYGYTAEQLLKRKKRNKYMLYSTFFVLTTLVTAIITVLVSSI
jgi:hypothetical protein